MAGCDIETYLLEKARITFQQEVERSYHIFYQMMQPAVGDLKKKCLLSNDIYDYHYVSQGKTKVQSIDDNEDLEFTHEAFQVLCFSEEEMWNVYKGTSAVMNLGELVGIKVPYITTFITIFVFRNSSKREERSSVNLMHLPKPKRLQLFLVLTMRP